MDVKRRYIKEAGYDVAEEFVETLQQLDIRTGIKIAKFIEGNIHKLPISTLTSTILGGVVMDDDNCPVTFALEIMKVKEYHNDNQQEIIILSDIKIVSMDEYLDLLNLNTKLNEAVTGRTSTRPQKNNRKRLQSKPKVKQSQEK
jgi:hypothetical protein